MNKKNVSVRLGATRMKEKVGWNENDGGDWVLFQNKKKLVLLDYSKKCDAQTLISSKGAFNAGNEDIHPIHYSFFLKYRT